jgi:hypothetical protein
VLSLAVLSLLHDAASDAATNTRGINRRSVIGSVCYEPQMSPTV